MIRGTLLPLSEAFVPVSKLVESMLPITRDPPCDGRREKRTWAERAAAKIRVKGRWTRPKGKAKEAAGP